MAKNMRAALGDSLRAEEQAVKTRFERAENILARSDFTHPADTDAAAETKTDETERVKRDSFTMPLCDYEQIAVVQKRCMRSEISPTKSEVLRAGLAALCALSDQELVALLDNLPKVRTGRKPGTTI